MIRARKILLLEVVVAAIALQTAFAGNTVGFDKQKNRADSGLITGVGRQEEAQMKEAGPDANAGISEVDNAQRDLEGLNNSISNAMYVAEQNKQSEADEQGVFLKVIIA